MSLDLLELDPGFLVERRKLNGSRWTFSVRLSWIRMWVRGMGIFLVLREAECLCLGKGVKRVVSVCLMDSAIRFRNRLSNYKSSLPSSADWLSRNSWTLRISLCRSRGGSPMETKHRYTPASSSPTTCNTTVNIFKLLEPYAQLNLFWKWRKYLHGLLWWKFGTVAPHSHLIKFQKNEESICIVFCGESLEQSLLILIS